MKLLGKSFAKRSFGWAAGLAVGAAVGLLGAGPMPEAAAATLTNVVETTSGPVQGTVMEGVKAFQGIRYAASPAGANRWTPPQPPTPSATVIEATTPGPSCPQPINQFSAGPPNSEDCLFLNVWTPLDAHRDNALPVFVWIHGGALVTGAGLGFDPSLMVAQDNVIVVTINYRLGALGWLAEAALADANGNSGNYGLMDQQLAMKWVQNNIRNFGGNPFRVTVGGESAGGLSTLSNLASPTAKGLFHGAIVESGAYMLFDVAGLATQEARGAVFATNAGCTGTDAEVAACLRALPVATLLATTPFTAQPTSGVPTLPLGLSQAFSSGQFNRVPVMNGTNHDEGRLFEPFTFDPTFTFVPGGPAQALIDSGTLTYPAEVGIFITANGLAPAADTATLAALYPPADFPNPDNNNQPSADEALAQIFTDVTFTCRGLRTDQILSSFVPVYAYEFNDPNAPDLFQPLIGFSYGASHASELQYLFDAATLQGPRDAAANAASPAPGAAIQPPPLTAGGQTLAAEMKGYWTNFVKHGTPNGVFVDTTDVDHDGDFDFVDRDPLAFWEPFNVRMGIQDLPPGPTRPHAIFNFATEHNCAPLTNLGLIGG
jgi:para-nitrobenzyl esterase